MSITTINKPLAIILHGYIGSGKSTLAYQLENKLPALRLSIDEWIVRLFGSNPPADSFFEIHVATKKLLHQVGFSALQAGASVIFDSGNWSATERSNLIETLQKLGSTPLIISLNCDPDIAWLRTTKRNQINDQQNLLIDINTFHALKDAFSELADEIKIPRLSINTTNLSQEVITNQVLKFLDLDR